MMTTRQAKGKRDAVERARKNTPILDEITKIVDVAARDMHGVFYEPQSTLQEIASALGRPAPDEIDDGGPPTHALIEMDSPARGTVRVLGDEGDCSLDYDEMKAASIGEPARVVRLRADAAASVGERVIIARVEDDS